MKKEVGDAPLHRIIGTMAVATVVVGDAEVNPMATMVVAGGINKAIQHIAIIAPVALIGLTGKGIPMVVRGIGPPADQTIDNTNTTAVADGVSAVRVIIEVVVALKGITHTGMPGPREIATETETETDPETSGRHRREMHQMAMVDRPSYNQSWKR